MTARTPKVLVLLEQVRPTGLVRQLLELLARLPDLGVEPRLVCIVRRGEDVDGLLREVGKRGIATDTLVETHAFDMKPLQRIHQIIAQWRPDILESHGYKTVAYAWTLRLVERDLPWVAFYHGRTTTDWKVRLYHSVERWAVSGASVIAPVAEGVESHFRTVDRERLVPIPNGLIPRGRPRRDRDAVREQLDMDSSVPLIGFVGRFSHEKAPDLFVQVFENLAATHPGLHGVMLGEGSLLAETKGAIERKGLAERIRVPGRVTRIEDYYGAMDALLIPSRSEIFPNVLLEAVSAEIPVAAAPVGGIPGVARDLDTVITASEIDVGSLTRAATEALALCDSRQLKESRRRLSRDYSLDCRAQRTAAMYRSVLERPS